MAKTGMTVYDLLISCPGDVEKYINVIAESVKKFNRLFGRSNNLLVNARYWRDDSYPEMGDRPQNIINRQLVNECDMMIAVFWTRFGTPTDKYGSGTEEEIEEMICSGRQVFLYFLDKPCPPSKYDSSYEDVKSFKERCKQRGSFREVSDERELSEQFRNHLAQYFLERLNKGESISSGSAYGKLLKTSSTLHNYFARIPVSGTENGLLQEKEEAIIQKIRSIQGNVLPSRRSGFNKIPGTVSDAIIYRKQKELIADFAAGRGVQIEPAFWNLGNLRRRVIGSGQVVVDGTAEERKRYEEIQDLCREIEEFSKY